MAQRLSAGQIKMLVKGFKGRVEEETGAKEKSGTRIRVKGGVLLGANPRKSGNRFPNNYCKQPLMGANCGRHPWRRGQVTG